MTRPCQGNDTNVNDPIFSLKVSDAHAFEKAVYSQSKPNMSEDRLIPILMKSRKHSSPALTDSTEINESNSIKSSRASLSFQPSILRRNSGEFTSKSNPKPRNGFSVLSIARLETCNSTSQDLKRKSCIASPESMGIAGALFQLSRGSFSIVPCKNEIDYAVASSANESVDASNPSIEAFKTVSIENDDKENICKHSPKKKRAVSVPIDTLSAPPQLGEMPLKRDVATRINGKKAAIVN